MLCALARGVDVVIGSVVGFATALDYLSIHDIDLLALYARRGLTSCDSEEGRMGRGSGGMGLGRRDLW